MNLQSRLERSLAISNIGLRRVVGIIGISLPFVHAIGKILVEGPGIQGSMSA